MFPPLSDNIAIAKVVAAVSQTLTDGLSCILDAFARTK